MGRKVMSSGCSGVVTFLCVLRRKFINLVKWLADST